MYECIKYIIVYTMYPYIDNNIIIILLFRNSPINHKNIIQERVCIYITRTAIAQYRVYTRHIAGR